MATDPPSDRGPSITSRVAELLRAAFTDNAAAATIPAESPQPPSAMELAVRTVSQSIERWRSTRGLLRFTEIGGRDRLVASGATVEIEVQLDPLTRLRAARARISLDDTLIDEVAIDGPTITLRAPAPPPGIYPLLVDALDRRDRQISRGNPEEAPIVQVIGDAPTAIIDAELLLGDAPRDLSPLRELGLRGWALVYFDLHPEDRQEAIRAGLRRHGLGRAAILVHPQSEIDFSTLGIDFHHLFAATRIRRIRGDGIGLALIVSDDSQRWSAACAADAAHLASTDLAQLAARLDGTDGLAPWEAIAHDLQRQRASVTARTWRLDVLSGAQRVAGNHCTVELDNRRARERLFALIDGARHSVHLQFYILRPSLFTERLAVRLIRAARAGVAVRLIVDALYSTQDVLGLTNPVVEGLGEEPGIEIVATAPISGGDRFEVGALKRRDHRKLIVIDGEVAIVGGRNCGDEYYTGFDEVALTDWSRHERVPWLDAHVELRGPLVPRIQRSFVTTWHRSGGPPVSDTADALLFPQPTPSGAVTCRYVSHRGLEDTNTLGAYEAMITCARDHLYILNDFPILASLRGGILDACARGVRVVLLTGSAIARRGDGTMLRGPLPRLFFEYMTKHRLEPLIRAGAEVYEYATPPLPEIVVRGGAVRPYVHAKVMTADGEVASIGSANLDVTASYWEHEANVVIEDPGVVGALEATIDDLLATSYRLDLESEYWRAEARLREIAATLWPETLYS